MSEMKIDKSSFISEKTPNKLNPKNNLQENPKTQTHPQYLEQACILVSRQKTAGFTKENSRGRSDYFATATIRNYICLGLQRKTMR